MITQNKESKGKESSEVSEVEDINGHVHGPNCNHHHHEAIRPIVRTSPKVGRNDPCPCGSQQKFKKCCGK